MINEYIDKYVELCNKLCHNSNNYTKSNVKIHNKSKKELSSLIHKISENEEIVEKVLNKLLDFDNETIKSTAATYCIALKINTTKAEEILEYISKNSLNSILAFNTEMTLKVWKNQGYLEF